VWMNGGFFVFDQEIFAWMKDSEELVVEPFQRLAEAGRLATIRHEGFWSCMDTYKEKQLLDERVAKGDTAWEIWNRTDQNGARLPINPSAAASGLNDGNSVAVPIMVG
jgi:NDP-sugar pyrophosphorylase family protein